jgi:hypothetical protein
MLAALVYCTLLALAAVLVAILWRHEGPLWALAFAALVLFAAFG